eukprot:TRINITY_DN465_c0_g1_i1.p1 TRINITY_DN465_c0_g1~~TRINITY_DN465_c0_g1_i1.p1  ORF type:complete len:141 (+),score=47.28 TRINITY_DN465_c0_g1_i1:35-457(+)
MDPKEATEYQKKWVEEQKSIQDAEEKLRIIYVSRTKLETQKRENEAVMEELKLLDEKSAIFKQVGPVLLKTDLDEAKGNVESRLKFFSGEIDKSEKNIKELKDRQAASTKKLEQIQELFQTAAKKVVASKMTSTSSTSNV